LDDEYALAGVRDPKILLTTSHDCSQRLIQFSKELKFLFPGAVRINRGKTKLKELVEMARAETCTDVVIVHEHGGIPGKRYMNLACDARSIGRHSFLWFF
jgi:U3 small nucleolar ribonucleoprotein protein IMP4